MEEKTKLLSIQPYFVLDVEGFCQRVLLQNGISHFFSFSNTSDKNITVPLLVDGCNNIIFEYMNGKVRTHFIGSTLKPRTFSAKRNSEYFGVRLQPSTSLFIRELSAKETIGEIIILDDFPSMKTFCKNMEIQRDFYTRMQTFMQEYSRVIQSGGTKNQQKQLFTQIEKLIIQRRGIIKISELEELSGYTSRYINRIFENELGLSAKQLCSTVKFQFLLGDLNKGDACSLTTLSCNYSFYDQSHFIKAFRDCTGKTPSQYTEEIAQRNYSNCIHNI